MLFFSEMWNLFTLQAISNLKTGPNLRSRPSVGRLVHHAQPLADDLVRQRQDLLGFRQTELLAAFLLGKFQLLPAQHQLRTCLVVELRGDVQALGFGKHVTRYFARSSVRLNDGSRCQCKFASTCFFPCWLHVSDVSHEVFVLLTRQLSDFERRHCLWCINVCSFHCCRI